MALLQTAEQLAGIDDREYEDVYVEKWDCSVRLSTMTAHERDAYEAQFITDPKGKTKPDFTDMRARYVAKCAVNEDGELIWKTREQVKALANRNARIVGDLFDVARKLNGMSDKDVEELEKKSEDAQHSDS